MHGSNGFKPKPSLQILSPSGAADGDTCLHGRWVPFLEAPVDDFLKKKTLSELSVAAPSLCEAAAP